MPIIPHEDPGEFFSQFYFDKTSLEYIPGIPNLTGLNQHSMCSCLTLSQLGETDLNNIDKGNVVSYPEFVRQICYAINNAYNTYDVPSYSAILVSTTEGQEKTKRYLEFLGMTSIGEFEQSKNGQFQDNEIYYPDVEIFYISVAQFLKNVRSEYLNM